MRQSGARPIPAPATTAYPLAALSVLNPPLTPTARRLPPTRKGHSSGLPPAMRMTHWLRKIVWMPGSTMFREIARSAEYDHPELAESSGFQARVSKLLIHTAMFETLSSVS
jgi:hypothetical protein